METSEERNIIASQVATLKFLAVNALSGGICKMKISVVGIWIMLLEMEST
jgi:hypothetical protein